VHIASEFGEMYFDGPREFGYGGYSYDGRWRTVAREIVDHFKLLPGDRLLDIGCAKGFLVKDLLELGIDAYGIDVSKYALMNCELEVVGRLHLGSADYLYFPNNSFDAVVSINTLHNLTRENCVRALREMQRLSPGKGFIQVDAYYTDDQKKVFEEWVLTAKYYGYPEEWLSVFQEAGYTGDWSWTIIE
jgi:cyclopropane fatty-acyl-phospholipid synthase-like methyltransferase